METSRAACAALAAALIALGGCGDDDSDTVAQEATTGAQQPPDEEQPLSPSEERGRERFIETCGSCHTLDPAGTTGQIGPDLNDIPLSEEEVLTAIRTGGRGSGNMPANLLTGRDAQEVAVFVARSGPGAP